MTHQDFEKYADEKQFNYSIPEKFREKFEACVDSLKISLKSIKILDFGCGDGKHYPFYIKSGFSPNNIYGAEVSKKRVARCQSIGWEKAFQVKEAVLPFSENEFDIIVMAEVIEHIPEEKIEKIFSELVRVIKNSGYIIITTPNYPIKRFYDLNDAFISHKWDRLKDDSTHINHYSVRKLEKFLKKYFNSVKIAPYKFGFLFRRFKKKFFLHKILAVCTKKI